MRQTLADGGCGFDEVQMRGFRERPSNELAIENVRVRRRNGGFVLPA